MRIPVLAWVLIVALLAPLQACDLFREFGNPDGPVRGVAITLELPGHVSHAFLTVGDRDTIRAQAYTGGWPSYTRYDSSSEPRRFLYSSSNPEVASVTLEGIVETRSVGATTLVASADGITSLPLLLTVSPSANSFVAEPDSIAVAVGESFTVSLKALDASNQSVRGVVFNVGVDTTYWAVTSMPNEGTWMLQTPTRLHLTGKMAGRVRIIATVRNERAAARFTASVPVSVRAP